jgi:hypothetical protein
MSHATELTESLVRHADEVRSGQLTDFEDMTTEAQARHVDEYRHAIAHADESESES